jgi:ribosomal-protein-serine acetyltransferase
VEDTQGFIRSTVQQYLDNQGFQAGIWANHELVGVAGFHPIDWQNKVASLGYWLREDDQGRGIMTLDDIPGTSPETTLARLPAHLFL